MTLSGPGPKTHGRLRRFGAGFALVLTCLLIVVANLATWTQQTLLNTDRYVAVVGNVPANPAVQAAIADRVSTQVVTALDLQDRIAGILPDKAGALAAPITAALQERIRTQVLNIVASDQFAQFWVTSQRALHEQLVKILRGDSTVITIDQDTLYLNLFPLVGTVLGQLQQEGLIPANVTLPDFSATDPDQVRQKLESTLGVTLSPTFGQLPLMSSAALGQAQLFVRILDALVIVLWLLVVLFGLLAIWAAGRRRRMVVMLALGSIIALLLTRLLIGAIEGAVISSIANNGAAATVQGIVDAAVDNLFAFFWWSVGIAALVALIAYLSGRPRSAPRLPAAPAVAGPAVGATVANGATVKPKVSGEGIRSWVRAHLRILRWVLPAIAIAIAAAVELGLEAVVLVVAAIALVELGLSALASEPAAETAEAAPPAPDEQAPAPA